MFFNLVKIRLDQIDYRLIVDGSKAKFVQTNEVCAVNLILIDDVLDNETFTHVLKSKQPKVLFYRIEIRLVY
jgi:hypothetical protein